ncbi:YbjN domain-containing protein [Natronohydrobacter thiooxidans]|uniref:YbjN domain-containing protein n=1 Tax=Natronohydrobacter thiooxidans TaxID=87172 RepID=UPI0008FF3ECE|nr:YbjN domain-containing protein [Natronohydrobacter thiooxidans]
MTAAVLAAWIGQDRFERQAAAPGFEAALVDGRDVAAIAEVARGFGSALIQRDDAGDPMIEGRIHGVVYRIYFYGCIEGADCRHLLLKAEWDNDGIDTLAFVNAWNRHRLLGRAYIDHDDTKISLDLIINLARGVSLYNLDDTFAWWADTLWDFHVKTRDIPPAPARAAETDL